MTKITLTRMCKLAAEKGARDAKARIAELEADRDKWFEAAGAHHVASMRDAQRADRAEAALDEIIMEATSRNHAIDIARRARAEGGE